LAHIRRETAERLEASGIRLEWPLEFAPQVTLSPALLHTMRSILREAVSNVIKHAGASRVTVSVCVENEALCLAIRDDGKGFVPDTVPPGHGLANMKQRAETRGGTLCWGHAK